MAAVKLETQQEGRGLHEWDYVSLGEASTVSLLIKNRSKIDATYYMKKYAKTSNVLATQGVCPFAEPIVCLYIDLDRLIDECKLKPFELNIIHWQMDGYSIADIANHVYRTRDLINKTLNNIIHKIVYMNNKMWSYVYKI